MKLSNSQIEILKLLFEAGGENIPTIANTFFANSRFARKEDFLVHLDDELQQLRQHGLIAPMYYLADSQPSWRYLTEDEQKFAIPARSCLVWDETARCWRWNTRDCGNNAVVIVIEETGRKLLIEQQSL